MRLSFLGFGGSCGRDLELVEQVGEGVDGGDKLPKLVAGTHAPTPLASSNRTSAWQGAPGGHQQARSLPRSGSRSSVGAMCWRNISITHQLARSLVLHGQGNGRRKSSAGWLQWVQRWVAVH